MPGMSYQTGLEEPNMLWVHLKNNWQRATFKTSIVCCSPATQDPSDSSLKSVLISSDGSC